MCCDHSPRVRTRRAWHKWRVRRAWLSHKWLLYWFHLGTTWLTRTCQYNNLFQFTLILFWLYCNPCFVLVYLLFICIFGLKLTLRWVVFTTMTRHQPASWPCNNLEPEPSLSKLSSSHCRMQPVRIPEMRPVDKSDPRNSDPTWSELISCRSRESELTIVEKVLFVV